MGTAAQLEYLTEFRDNVVTHRINIELSLMEPFIRGVWYRHVRTTLCLHPQQTLSPHMGYPSPLPKEQAKSETSYPSGQSSGYPSQLYRSVSGEEVRSRNHREEKC